MPLASRRERAVTSWDPLDRHYADNPFYRMEAGRGGVGRTAQRILAYGSLAAVLLGLVLAVLAAIDGDAEAAAWSAFTLVIPAWLLVGWGTPAFAATVLDIERDSGTLPMTLLTPYPRRAILNGLLAARLRSLVHLVGCCLPIFLALGFLVGEATATASSARSNQPVLHPALLGVLIAAALWGVLLLQFLYSAAAGAYAAVNARSTGAAVGIAYALTFGLGCAVSMVCSFFYIFVLLIAPWVLADAARKKFESEDVL